MAVTLTQAELSAALRLTGEPEDIAEATRLLAYASLAVEKYAPDAPDLVQNEGAIRVCGYLFDMPFAARSDGYANAMRNSGASRLLLPYRIHRAGSTGENVETAQAADGTEGIDTDAVQALIDAHAAMTDIHHRPSSRVGVVNLVGARLPASIGVTMRIGWSNTQDYSEDVFTRDGNHPDDGAAGGTIAGVFPPVQPAGIPDIPDVAVNEKYLHIWVGEIPGNVAQLTFFGAPAHGVSEAAAQTYNTTDGTWWVSNLPISAGISAYAFSATVAGLLIATQQWVTAQIANIMLSGGGITTAQAQTLIDAAVVNFQTDTQVETLVAAAISGLPDYQTLAEVTTLITAAVAALSLGQTAAEVSALITVHAGTSSAHHVKTPAGGGGGSWYWAGHVTGGAWVADTSRNASLLGFPLAGFADYAALRTAVLDASVKQIAIRISQNDPNGADDDVGVYIVPNISGFWHGAVGNYRAFPAWGIGVDPIKFDVKFTASHLTIVADAAITAASGVFVRIGIWA